MSSRNNCRYSTSNTECRNNRASCSLIIILSLQSISFASSFLSPIPPTQHHVVTHRQQHTRIPTPFDQNDAASHSPSTRRSSWTSTSTTALNVWWFGGNEAAEQVGNDEDSCELVPVRIERTSPNSRKIFGEITAPVPMEDVWAILTDYDRLSTHVPNLVESKIVQKQSNGAPGDGNYRCRLYQKGAQKIVGFEFGASVTMDMAEYTNEAGAVVQTIPPATAATASSTTMAQRRASSRSQFSGRPVSSISAKSAAESHEAVDLATSETTQIVPSTYRPRERRITFKCYDSFFFQEFDGEWKVQERLDANGNPECVLSYVVDVRPKGPVPVAALEWRIREDVPTNLRAVKRAALEQGYEGVVAFRETGRGRAVPRRPSTPSTTTTTTSTTTNTVANASPASALPQRRRIATSAASETSVARNGQQQPQQQQQREPKRKLARALQASIVWDRDETMAAYLDR